MDFNQRSRERRIGAEIAHAINKALGPGNPEALGEHHERAGKMAGPGRSKAFIDAMLEHEDDPWVAGIDVFNPNELQVYEAAKLERLRDLHGPLIDEIDARDSAEREVRDLVFAVVRVDLQNDSGLEGRDFEAFAKPIENRMGAPWILKDKKSDGTEHVLVCEIKADGTAAYRPASIDEARDGKECPDLAAYQASRAA